MAGNYPDVPSYRMAYDRDGTQVYKIDASNNITQVSDANVLLMNDEDDDEYVVLGQNTNGAVVFIFPELRDLSGWFRRQSSNSPGSCTVQVSSNTTNGLDGTWTTISTANNVSEAIRPTYRTGIVSASSLGIKAVKFTAVTGSGVASFRLSAVHLYGVLGAGENPDRLAIWQPASDARVGPAYFDFDDVARNTSSTITFRVKNLSAGLTANSVRVAEEVMTDGSPSVPAQYMLSLDGIDYFAQVNLGNLAPGAISGVITLRRITPSNAQLSVWALRLFAEADSWS